MQRKTNTQIEKVEISDDHGNAMFNAKCALLNKFVSYF